MLYQYQSKNMFSFSTAGGKGQQKTRQNDDEPVGSTNVNGSEEEEAKMAAIRPSAHASLSRQPRRVDAQPDAQHRRRRPRPRTSAAYVGTIFYSFPMISFTLPFGGSLKLLGIELLPP